MQTTLDKTDFLILAALQEDGSLSAAELAKRVGLSQSPCWRRVHRLETLGVIDKRVTLLNRRRLGLNTVVFVEVKCARGVRRTLERFESTIRAFPEVQEAHMLMGDKDFLLKVVTSDIDAFERFIRERLSVLPAVLEVRSFMALSTIKASTALPLKLSPAHLS